MQAIRIYKIKIRENILRQIIFTNKNVFIGLSALNIVIIWMISESMPVGTKLTLSILSSGLSLLIFTSKIDGQSFFKIIFRMIKFYFNQKKFRE